MGNKHVAIIGVSGIFPEANNLTEFYENLVQGRDSVRKVGNNRITSTGQDSKVEYMECAYIEGISHFDHAYFNIPFDDAKYMDPSQRKLLELSVIAIENASYNVDELRGRNIGTFIGIPEGCYYNANIHARNGVTMVGNMASMTAGRIAYHLNLTGPAININTACSSALVSVHQAILSLSAGECEMALVGAFKTLTEFRPTNKNDHELDIYSKDGKTRPFDKLSTGTGPGEGGGIIFLKLLEDAERDKDDIKAVIISSAVNQDAARSNGITAPSPSAQTELLLKAWHNAELIPSSVGYIEAHGTGTKLGDPIEFQAISQAFKRTTDRVGFCALSAVKSNIGHLDHAAGIAGLIKVVLSLRFKKLFRTVHYSTPNPYIDTQNSAAYICSNTRDWNECSEPRRGGVSAFGLSGTNAHVILEEYSCQNFLKENDAVELKGYYLKVGAKSLNPFSNVVEQTITFLTQSQESLLTLTANLNVVKGDYKYRYCVWGKNKNEILTDLKLCLQNPQLPLNTVHSLFLVLIGEPMQEELFASLCSFYATFKNAAEKIETIIPLKGKYDFAFRDQYALLKLFETSGIVPGSIITIGVGKLANDYVNGLISDIQVIEQLKHFESKSEEEIRKTLNKVIGQFSCDGIVLLELGSDRLKYSHENFDKKIVSTLSFISIEARYEHCIPVLYNWGFEINWKKIYSKFEIPKIEIPSYPFQNISCWNIQIHEDLKGENEKSTAYYSKAEKSDVSKKLLELWQEQFNDHSIDIDDDYFELGGTSVNMILMIENINNTFNIKLDDLEFYDYPTVKLLIDRVMNLLENENDK